MTSTRKSLLHVPDPILDESPASWVMRLCQYHESWPNRLCQVFEIPKMNDLDTDLCLAQLLTLTQGTRINEDKLICLDSKFSNVRESELAQLFLLQTGKKLPFYRYCPECLASDLEPYWRMTWRMAHVFICATHNSRLLTVCRACGQPVAPVQHMHSRFGAGLSEPICRYCPSCTGDLASFSAIKIDHARVGHIVALQNVITASLLRGHFFVKDVADALPLRLLPRTLLMRGGPCELVDRKGLAPPLFVSEFLKGGQANNNGTQQASTPGGHLPSPSLLAQINKGHAIKCMRVALKWRFSEPIAKAMYPTKKTRCWL